MPSRLITAAILAFWLTMTGWLIQREVVPTMLADVAPSFHIDLTEEIEWTERNDGKRGAFVRWTVDYNGARVGKAKSRVVANEDRSYELHCAFKFDDGKFAIGPLNIDKMESMYRIADDKLLALSADIEANVGKVKIQGDVVAGFFDARLFGEVVLLGKFDYQFDKLNLPQHGSVLNPMLPVNRLRVNGMGGLYDGKTWKIPLLNPFADLAEKFVGKGMTIPMVIAIVSVDTLEWDKKDTACFKIEYHEPGKEVTARTWVRKLDGLVLRQESKHHGFEMVLQRIP